MPIAKVYAVTKSTSVGLFSSSKAMQLEALIRIVRCSRTVPIFYLPKSWPTVPPFRGNIMTDFAHPNTRIKRIRLARIVSQPSKSKSKAQQTQEITKRPQITVRT